MSKKQSDKNQFFMACAGSGKTTFLVKEAIRLNSIRILFTTYTLENLQQIENKFYEEIGYIPSNVTIQSWFSFLLQDGVRPYQNQLVESSRVRSIYFQTKGNTYHRKDKYFTKGEDIYSNKLSEFVHECNKKTGGRIIDRLEGIYDNIFIDELQDLAGYDLDFLDDLINSSMNILGVGDSRQATFTTNKAQKNKKYRKAKIYDWLNERQKEGKITLKEKNRTWRYNSIIAEFASNLYPQRAKTISEQKEDTGHDGIFAITENEVEQYVKKHNPQVLRHDRRTNTLGLIAINFGLSKGRTYDRVLIFLTKPMRDYLKTKDLTKAGEIAKFYIAVTRAKYSVTFVLSAKDKALFEETWEK